MRPAYVGSPNETALAALVGLRARIALLDRTAVVVWINSSWSRYRQGQSGDTVAAVAVGVNYIAVCRRSRHPAGLAIAEGVHVVVERAVTFFELEYDSLGAQGRRTKLSVTPVPAGQDGAVVMQMDSYGPTETSPTLNATKAAAAATPLPPEVLTGRERGVLALMARGLDNQAIANELGIGYATVRGHVRSLMAKLGARSRLEAVVRAVQLDLVRVPRPTAAIGTQTARE
jgi:DNA-binding CsgD family transcriptional regulator